jgi:hypothetical protein
MKTFCIALKQTDAESDDKNQIVNKYVYFFC